MRIPSCTLRCWESDAIMDPIPRGLDFTIYFVVEGRPDLKLPWGKCIGWRLQAMVYTNSWSALPPPRQVHPETRALLLVINRLVTPPRPEAQPAPVGGTLPTGVSWGQTGVTISTPMSTGVALQPENLNIM